MRMFPLHWLLASALLASSAAAQAGVKIQHWRAASGAQVYFVESRALPIVDVRVDFSAGSAFDPADKAGLAAMTQALLQTGAGGMDEETVAGKLVDSGAQLSGSTEPDRAGMAIRSLSSAAERDAAIALLRALLQAPAFVPEVLERERARTIAGIREGETRPDSIAGRRFNNAIYPHHPYGLQATAESVARIARDDLLAFHRAHYSAPRAVVSIIGDLSRAQAEAIAQQLTDALPVGSEPVPLPVPAAPQRSVIRVEHPAQQSHIIIGAPGMRRGDPDYFALLVGNHILGGGGFESRLMKEVREKRGYAYAVYSYFVPLEQPGPFQIGLQTKREQVGEALKVVDATLTGFLRDGPTATELKRAKQNIADGFGLRLDSNRKILANLAVIGFYGLPLSYLDDYPRAVEKVTAAQIRDAFARRVRPEHMVTVVVGGAS